jgi:hypothetical protein
VIYTFFATEHYQSYGYQKEILSVIRHYKTHKDDCSPDMVYTYPLALILSGEVGTAKQLLLKEKSIFPLFAKKLNKKATLKK